MSTAFASLYGRAPQWFVRAPGRVNLIGEHTDFNGGFVLPMAIERYTEIAAIANQSNLVTLRSSAFADIMRVDLTQPIEPAPKGHWTNYPKGTLAGFLAAGYPLRGFDALIDSTVPLGGGLSSSASLEVAMATLLELVSGVTLDPVEKATLCREAEHAYARVPCGIMDQFICALGRENHLMLLDCRSQEMQWIEFADPEISLLIIETKVKHQLAAGEYALRRSQCETAAKILGVPFLREAGRAQLEAMRGRIEPTVLRRARHVIGENARTVQAAHAIRDRNWIETGRLMYASHESLRDDFEVSCRELDTVVAIAQDIGVRDGVFGCRMTGGGFGGCAVALIETRAHAAIVGALTAEYKAATGIEPTLFVSRPVAGAAVVHSTDSAA